MNLEISPITLSNPVCKLLNSISAAIWELDMGRGNDGHPMSVERLPWERSEGQDKVVYKKFDPSKAVKKRRIPTAAEAKKAEQEARKARREANQLPKASESGSDVRQDREKFEAALVDNVGLKAGKRYMRRHYGTKHYESGMSISLQNGKCIVFFRGHRHTLRGEFDTFDDARRAGEQFCRKLGWAG